MKFLIFIFFLLPFLARADLSVEQISQPSAPKTVLDINITGEIKKK